MRKKVLYVVVIAAILAICYFLWDMFGSTGNPEPLGSNPGKDTLTEEVRDTTKPVVQQQQQQTIKPSGDTTWISYTIKSGDVLGKISTRFNVRLAVLMKKNKLKSDQVKLGDQLWVPVREEHNVVAGENIDVLSKKYQIAKERILAANGFKTAAELKAGAKIVIPF